MHYSEGRSLFVKFWHMVPCLALFTLFSMSLWFSDFFECDYFAVNYTGLECLGGAGGVEGWLPRCVSKDTVPLTVISSLTSTWWCNLFLFLGL